MNILDTNIQYLNGVGPKRATLLKNELGIETVGELIRLFPYRYIDRTSIVKINNISPDTAFIQIKAKVLQICLYNRAKNLVYSKNESLANENINNIKFNTISRLSVIVGDGTGQCELVFFKGIKYIFHKLDIGKIFIFFGKPSNFGSKINIVHPEIDQPTTDFTLQGKMTGVYNSTEKLKNSGFTGKVMNKLMANALNLCLREMPENLPDYIIKDKNLVSTQYSLQNIHFPKDIDSLKKAEYRLKFEELFLLQLSLLKQKYINRRNEHGIVMSQIGKAFNECYNSLPYSLTNAQKRVIKEIREDMRSGKQMNRLLQGDVGSGKTLVALLSALIVIGNNTQACIMAPTEVLAQQHFATISKYLAHTNVKIALLTGSTKTADRKKLLPELISGDINIIVGTHALIEDNVIFKKLGLAIIDEQHRFGVEQRSKLWGKQSDGYLPHILVMTATPIPRTLAMTLYGDLDVSVIDELPPGRKPIQTILITESKRYSLNKFLKEEIAEGRQIFVVYPLIFESEKLDYQNLEQGYEQMITDFPLPDYKVAIVHGKQSNEEKNLNMSAFSAGKANILVSTTVIEVGVDVPNASVMVIESAERFGLSQLHQLRGRVGRGSSKSYCILIKGNKVSNESQKRLELLCSTEDGFTLAEEDMKMRGPGDLEGTQQSGLPISLNIASLAKDGRLLSEANEYAQKILEKDPELSHKENRILLEELRKNKYSVKDFSKIS